LPGPVQPRRVPIGCWFRWSSQRFVECFRW
jgi:hypothetical protein